MCLCVASCRLKELDSVDARANENDFSTPPLSFSWNLPSTWALVAALCMRNNICGMNYCYLWDFWCNFDSIPLNVVVLLLLLREGRVDLLNTIMILDLFFPSFIEFCFWRERQRERGGGGRMIVMNWVLPQFLGQKLAFVIVMDCGVCVGGLTVFIDPLWCFSAIDTTEWCLSSNALSRLLELCLIWWAWLGDKRQRREKERLSWREMKPLEISFF